MTDQQRPEQQQQQSTAGRAQQPTVDGAPASTAGTSHRLAWPLAAALLGALVVVVLGGLLVVRQMLPRPGLEAASAALSATAPATPGATSEAVPAAAPAAAGGSAPTAAALPTATPLPAVAAPTAAPTLAPTQPPATATPLPSLAAAAAAATTAPTVIATVPIAIVQGTLVAGALPPPATPEPSAWWNVRMAVPQDQANAILAAYFDLQQQWAQAMYEADPAKLQRVDAGAQLPYDLNLMQQWLAEGHTLKMDVDHTRTRVLWLSDAQAAVFDEFVNRSIYVDATTKAEVPTDAPPDTQAHVYLLQKVDGQWKLANSVKATNVPAD